ncbi:MAG TPA: hypothetical protein VFP49_08370 [Nitrososphaeraceae archaeon]|nr:hypothetical protein [Nitrososphaeraceae archaeon]
MYYFLLLQNKRNFSVIDTTSNTVIDTISVGVQSDGIAYDPVNERIYVTNFGNSTVSVINL